MQPAVQSIFRPEARPIVKNDDQKDETVPPHQTGLWIWHHFFALQATIKPSEDFLLERPPNVPPLERDLFGSDP
jgi:hypothetical protein